MSNWTPALLKLLGTMPDAELAKRVGCAQEVVFQKRRTFGISAFGKSPFDRRSWGTTELGMFGYTNDELALITGRTVEEIAAKRRELGR
jgi:hypothetical protein